jgi:release factor glutamine methyltransferase
MEKASTLERIKQVIARHRRAPYVSKHTQWGYKFVVSNGVFSPFIAPSGELGLAFSSLPVLSGKRVLDVGCGSGVIACLLALNGAEKVIGVDINEKAIENAKLNAKGLGLSSRVEFRLGSIFAPLSADEEFDLIYADLPFTDGEPSDMLEAAFYDKDLATIRKLIDEFSSDNRFRKAHLFLASSRNDVQWVKSIAESHGLSLSDCLARDFPWLGMQISEIQRMESDDERIET